jgi:hypothetical protein
MKKIFFVLENFGMMWACVFGSWLGFFIFGNNEKLLIANMLFAILVALSRIIFLLNKVD